MNAGNAIVLDKPFLSISGTAKRTGLSQYFLRQMLKKGKLPGVYVGVKYMVNVDALLKQVASGE